MKTKIFSLFLMLTMSIGTIFADALVDGIWYFFVNNTAWVISSNSYADKYSGDIVIPVFVTYDNRTYSVTSIRNGAFSGCNGLTSVTIPNSVTSIGNSAFSGCSSLTSIVIPNSVTNIGSSAFSDCTGLTSVTIGNGVMSIGLQAFKGCSSLQSISIPNGVTSISNGICEDCEALESVTLGNNVENIGYSAFYNCSALSSIIIPNSVTSIGYRAFSGCSGLTSVTIPNSVTDLLGYAFYGCTNLTSVTIGNSVTSIGEGAFSQCSRLTSVTIPNSVTSIGEGAFSGCICLTSVTIPNSVTSIGKKTFSGCHMTSITIPNSVTSIGNEAFRYCTKLSSITIPNSVTNIGDEAFSNCHSLASVIFSTGDGELVIGNKAFEKNYKLESVTIPGNVTQIMPEAFKDAGLKTLTMYCPTEVLLQINGNYSQFSGCNSLRIINLVMGRDWNEEENNITVPSLLKIFDSQVLAGLRELNFLSGSKYIKTTDVVDGGAIDDVRMPNLEVLNLSEGIIGIGYGSFVGCTNLKNVSLPQSIKYIGGEVFSNSGLEHITIGTELEEIPYGFCANCNKLERIGYIYSTKPKLSKIGDRAFQNCSALTFIELLSSVTEIGNYAFSGCLNVTQIKTNALLPPICHWDYNWESRPFNGIVMSQCALIYPVDEDLGTYNPDDPTDSKQYHYNTATVWEDFFKNGIKPFGYDLKKFYGQVGNAFNKVHDAIPNNNQVSILYHVVEGAKVYAIAIQNSNTGVSQIYTFSADIDLTGNESVNQLPSRNHDANIDEESTSEFYIFTTGGLTDNTDYEYSITAYGENEAILTEYSGTFKTLTQEIGRGDLLDLTNTATDISRWTILNASLNSSSNSVTGQYAYDIRGGIPSTTYVTANPNIVFQTQWASDKTKNFSIYPGQCYQYNGRNGVLIIKNTLAGDTIQITVAAKGNTSANFSGEGYPINATPISTDLILPAKGSSGADDQGYVWKTLEYVSNGGNVEIKEFAGGYRIRKIKVATLENETDTIEFIEHVKIDNLYYDLDIVNHTATVVYDTSNKNLTTINIPSTITYNQQDYNVTIIGDSAFYYCPITNVDFPTGLKKIGGMGFYGCAYLTSVSIPNTVTDIGPRAFVLCTGLSSIILSSNLQQISDMSFYGCENLTSITIPDGVTIIGEYAFANCGSLDSVSIPNSVVTIKRNAFSRCFALKNITIPNSVTEVGREAFSPSGLLSIMLPNSISVIAPSTFSGCGDLVSVTIPNSVQSIGASAFWGCTGLVSVTIPNSVTSIGEDAFRGVANIDYPAAVTGSPWGAKCTYGYVDGALVYSDATESIILAAANVSEEILIKRSVSGIRYNAFCDCSKLTSFVVESENPKYTSIDGVIFRKDTTVLSFYPKGKTTEVYTLPFGLTRVGCAAFYQARNLHNVIIPKGVTMLENYAFYESGIESVVLPEDLDTIGYAAFSDCSKLRTITCYSATPPALKENAFLFFDIDEGNLPKLYVPAASISAYQSAEGWNAFTNIMPISALETSENEVSVYTSTANTVVVEWPSIEGADTYIVEIFEGNTSICALIFDAQGRLLSIQNTLPALARDNSSNTRTAIKTNTGWQYTITGLDANKQYIYTFTAKSNNVPIYTQSVAFSTPLTTSIEGALDIDPQTGKLLRNGQILILRGDRTYTVTGQELK